MQRFSRLSALTVFLGVVFFYPLAAPMHHRIDEEHFELIRIGMTSAEVEAIFGVPPGIYDWVIGEENPRTGWTTVVVGPPPVNNAIPPVGWERDPNKDKIWISRHGVFGVSFDHRNRVTSLQPSVGRPMTEPPWKRWWRMLRTQ